MELSGSLAVQCRAVSLKESISPDLRNSLLPSLYLCHCPLARALAFSVPWAISLVSRAIIQIKLIPAKPWPPPKSTDILLVFWAWHFSQ